MSSLELDVSINENQFLKGWCGVLKNTPNVVSALRITLNSTGINTTASIHESGHNDLHSFSLRQYLIKAFVNRVVTVLA
ncbi:hypothetical protein KY289_005531 [Solanum tuberosum]|nr:hypothetical protein KY289_005531 [Solanum tuberosum]